MREDANLRGRAPGETAANVIEGYPRGAGVGLGPGQPRGEGARRDGGGQDRPAPGDPGRSRRVLRGRCRQRVPRGDGGRGHVARRDGLRGPG